MTLRPFVSRYSGIALALCVTSLGLAQPPDFGGRGFGGGGFGGRGGMGQQRTKLLPQFDKDGKGYLNAAERKATAREYLATQAEARVLAARGGRFGTAARRQGPSHPDPASSRTQ